MLNAIELDKVAKRHPQTRSWLETWKTVVVEATWRNLAELRRTYPAADGVVLGKGKNKLVVTVFNVGGNDFRLLTRIAYKFHLVQVLGVITHAEYSKDKWKHQYT